MNIFNLRNKIEFLDEVCELEYDEWASKPEENRIERINEKKKRILNSFDNNLFCKLILLDNNELVGFVSMFPSDCDEEPDLTPWYATMYVKEKYRNKGYSKILNNAILNEAKNRGFNMIYLKTTLNNYYEKFGAVFMRKVNNNEKLYKIELK